MRDPYEKELDAECYAYAGMSYAEVLEAQEFEAWQKQENEITEAEYRMECIEAATMDWEE